MKARNFQATPLMCKQIEPERPWRIIATDIIGGITPRRVKSTHIIVSIDLFSKYTEGCETGYG